jgi:hypothetical protein
MKRDYWPLVQTANQLDQFIGYLDTAGEKELAKAKGEYRTALSRVSYELIADLGGAAAAASRAAADFDDWAASETEWSETIRRVKDDLLVQIEVDSQKSNLRRWVKYYSLPIIIALGVTAYLGTWWYNDITIDQPLETRDGLVQRAQAYEKARQFDEWMSGRGGLIKRVILSAVEPDEAELQAAQEFLGVVLQGHAKLEAERTACGLAVPVQASDVSDPHLKLADLVSEQLQDKSTVWVTPPVMTILPVIAQTYPCAVADKNFQPVGASKGQ